jgi:hypothetical protein
MSREARGHPGVASAVAADMRIDRYSPESAVTKVIETRVKARPSVVFTAVRDTDLRDPVVSALLGLSKNYSRPYLHPRAEPWQSWTRQPARRPIDAESERALQ